VSSSGDLCSGPAAMKVKIEDPSLLSELVDYLRRCDCTLGFNDGLLEVRPRQLPIAASLWHEELELDSYLKVLSAFHPGARVELVHERRRDR
jgi:hypothetical protein